MINFIWYTPFLRIALWVAMSTMHFDIAEKKFFVREHFFFSHLGDPREQNGTNEKFS